MKYKYLKFSIEENSFSSILRPLFFQDNKIVSSMKKLSFYWKIFAIMDQNLFANLPAALGRRQNQQLLSFDDDMVDVAFYKFIFDNLEFLKLWKLDTFAVSNLP